MSFDTFYNTQGFIKNSYSLRLLISWLAVCLYNFNYTYRLVHFGILVYDEVNVMWYALNRIFITGGLFILIHSVFNKLDL